MLHTFIYLFAQSSQTTFRKKIYAHTSFVFREDLRLCEIPQKEVGECCTKIKM